METVTTSTRLACSPSELRTFLGTPANFKEISDPELEFELISAPDEIAPDAVIEFRVSTYGFKQRISHRWVEATPERIVAEQIDGPTKSWRHSQTIEATDSGCQLTDMIEFEPPGGMLGFVMTADKIKDSIAEGMDHRYETLQDRFGAG